MYEETIIATLAISFIVIIVILPFILNAILAKSRGKNVILILFLTFIFSYIITLILALLPKSEKK